MGELAARFVLFAQATAAEAEAVVPASAPSDPQFLSTRTTILLVVVFALSVAAYIVGLVLQRQPESSIHPAAVKTFTLRVRSWLMMCGIVVLGLLIGPVTTVVLFGLLSFWALREFITLTPTRHGDHRALFWIFFIFTPLQYILVGLALQPGQSQFYYGLYSIVLPVYGTLFIAARVALSGDPRRFLERMAKIQSGLIICVYSLSYTPALLTLELGRMVVDNPVDPLTDLPHALTTPPARHFEMWQGGRPEGLLFYFILITQLGDVFQYVWGKLLGGSAVAPEINSGKTWGGFFGGVASTTIVGALLWWATPFYIWEAACISLLTAMMGFAGSMVMSAVKRDRGVKDYGTLVQGHAGVLDRIDSVCFAAPVFFHLTRFYFSNV